MKRMIVFAFAFAVGICSILLLGFVQTKENDEKTLQRRWVLENVSAFDENVEVRPFSADSIPISTEIDIQQDELTFVLESGEF